MKKLLAALVLLCILTTLVVACGGGSGSPGSPPTAGPCPPGRCIATSASVHLGLTNFVQTSVTFAKGGSLTIVDDSATVHNINNGSWMNGVAHPLQETGAPTVSNLMFSTAGQSRVIGPFNTAGTFHLYCSIHTGMNLTITVT